MACRMEGFGKPGAEASGLRLPRRGPDTRWRDGGGGPARDGGARQPRPKKKNPRDGDVARVKSTPEEEGGGDGVRIASWMVRRNMACASIRQEFHGGGVGSSPGRVCRRAPMKDPRGVAAAGVWGAAVRGPLRRSEGPSRRCGMPAGALRTASWRWPGSSPSRGRSRGSRRERWPAPPQRRGWWRSDGR